MSIIKSTYSPPYVFRNGHISTIYPNLFRKIKSVSQTRERLELRDGDFIDLDWSYASENTKKIAIIVHGLEGNAQRQYMLGIARYLNQNNWNAVCVNLRNCSGEINRLYQSYNAGVSQDIEHVVKHVLSKNEYQNISLCGFSLGGNIILKYLGEGRKIPTEVKAAVAISTPCDLYNSLLEINKSKNYLYEQRFIKHLKGKLFERADTFPDKISKSDIKACSSLIDIDDLYTSVAHGYQNALDYYDKCSSKQFLKNIEVPTLIINATNDSFLGNNCYPEDETRENPNVFLEMPKYGGHVGFYTAGKVYYNESRTLAYFNEMI